MATFVETTTFTVISCCNCGVQFGITESFERWRRKDHEWFYCPAGHAQHYSGENETEKLRSQLAAKDREIAAQRSRVEAEQRRVTEAREQRDTVTRSLRATRAVVTRTKKKIVAGRCPCCSHQFKDLKVQMATQHPAYDPEKAVAAMEAKA